MRWTHLDCTIRRSEGEIVWLQALPAAIYICREEFTLREPQGDRVFYSDAHGDRGEHVVRCPQG